MYVDLRAFVRRSVLNCNCLQSLVSLKCIKYLWEPNPLLVAEWATSRKVPGSIPARFTGDFFRSIRQVHVPGVDSASKNDYQDIPGGKGEETR